MAIPQHQAQIVTPQQQAEQVVVASTQQQSSLNVSVIRGLGITQIVLGVLTTISGIIPIAAISNYWLNEFSFGIWFGVWITVAGVIGLISSFRPQNNILNGVNMGFNIVCTVISVINTIFAGIGVGYFSSCTKRGYYSYDSSSKYIPGYYTPSYYSPGYYRPSYYGTSYYVPSYYSGGYYRPGYYSGGYYKAGDYYLYSYGNSDCREKDIGTGIYAFLLLLMIGEFVISLIISIFCCKAGCACCKRSTGGQVVYAQQPPASAAYPTTTSHTAYTTTNTGYPQAGYPGTAIPYNSGAPVMHHGQMVNQQHVMMGAHTNIVYSAEQQQQPPQYQKSPPQ